MKDDGGILVTEQLQVTSLIYVLSLLREDTKLSNQPFRLTQSVLFWVYISDFDFHKFVIINPNIIIIFKRKIGE